jgi:hypothetical protein
MGNGGVVDPYLLTDYRLAAAIRGYQPALLEHLSRPEAGISGRALPHTGALAPAPGRGVPTTRSPPYSLLAVHLDISASQRPARCVAAGGLNHENVPSHKKADLPPHRLGASLGHRRRADLAVAIV